MDLPVFTFSCVTAPSPSTLIVSEYFCFSKLAVIVWLELTDMVNGLSKDSIPDQPLNTYSDSGVAVIVTEVPDS